MLYINLSMKLHYFFFLKRVIIDFFRIIKNIRYMFYFFKFSLLNYGILKRIGNIFIRFIYVYIIGYYFYLVYTFLYKKMDFFILTNIINVIQSKLFFIYDEMLDLTVYNSNIPKLHLYAKLSENIGSFYHSHYKIYNRGFEALKRSRLTPAQFDAEQYYIIENVYSDRYFSIYLYDIFYSIYIRSIINFYKTNRFLFTTIKYQIKNNFLTFYMNSAIRKYLIFLFAFFNLFIKVISTIINNRFKYSSLIQIPRERLLNLSFSEGFQGNLYYEKTSLIKEKKTKLILNPVMQQSLAGTKYKKLSFLTNYHLNLFQTYEYNELNTSRSIPYNLNSIQFATKEPDYSIFVEFRKSNFRSPNRNTFFLNKQSDFLILNDKLKTFLKNKKSYKFIYYIFGSKVLYKCLNLFKTYQNNTKWQSIFKIQSFIDSGGWILFFILLIITIDLSAFFLNHVI